MTRMDMDCLIQNIPSIKKLSHEWKESIFIEAFLKKCPGCKRGVGDGSIPLVCAVGTGE